MEKLNSLDDVLNFIFKVWYDKKMSVETIDIPNKDINEPIP